MEIHTPPELRVLCFQLSSISPIDLPRQTPALQRLVLACNVPLSGAADNSGKGGSSASSTTHVLIHKLKTQLTTLLYGKSAEGRFAAAVLIKAVVEVGGWEVLRGSEPWVRGLLSILGKPDSAAAKEVCIIALTKIYCLTHQYQTLLREITTPTLPAFVTACISMISTKSVKSLPIPSLSEAVLRSFSLLVPRHNTIFRPFASQIRALIRRWLAPNVSSAIFTPSSLTEAARSLMVVLHQTAAKNTAGEEWGKAVRDVVKEIHLTCDQVFRAVFEDWESAAGYVSVAVDVNEYPSGGGKSADDLPSWSGIDAGIARLTGRLKTLSEYFRHETSTSVSISLGAVLDLTARILSISAPSAQDFAQEHARLNPAIDRDEKDRLWAGLPGIHVAVLDLLCSIEERLRTHFTPLAQMTLDQLIWAFPTGKRDPGFRTAAYDLTARMLRHIEQSLNRTQTLKLAPIVRSCCHDVRTHNSTAIDSSSLDGSGIMSTGHGKGSGHGANISINSIVSPSLEGGFMELTAAARDLLPLFFSHLPQHHLDIVLRSQLEREAILTHNHEAMLASIVYPFLGKNRRAFTSILPHLSREIPYDSRLECLLRPRMPVLPFHVGGIDAGRTEEMDVDDEEVAMGVDEFAKQSLKQTLPSFMTFEHREQPIVDAIAAREITPPAHQQPAHAAGFGPSALRSPPQPAVGHVGSSIHGAQPLTAFAESPGGEQHVEIPHLNRMVAATPMPAYTSTALDEEVDSSGDDESVHLTMALDTESEDEK